MIQLLSSVRITVVCLFLLFVLTFWGTVAQVQQGLYAAQERYFYSFFFRPMGWLIFPGAQLVLWVLFFNLIAAAINHFRKLHGLRYVGLKISHLGILIYFISAFLTFHVMQESAVRLGDGEGTNVSASYTQWELAYWNQEGNRREVTAYDVNDVRPGQVVPFTGVPWSMKVKQFYLNAQAFTNVPSPYGASLLNASGIDMIEPRPLFKEREKNIAAGTFDLKLKDGRDFALLLYGTEAKPTVINVQGKNYYFALRHKRYQLPFTILLKQFKAQFHPGTNIAKSYESRVDIIKPGATREVRIYMNNPLRDHGYTFYQASYDTDVMGNQYSTFAVVKNYGRILPYVACFVVFFGLALHFIMAALRRKKEYAQKRT